MFVKTCRTSGIALDPGLDPAGDGVGLDEGRARRRFDDYLELRHVVGHDEIRLEPARQVDRAAHQEERGGDGREPVPEARLQQGLVGGLHPRVDTGLGRARPGAGRPVRAQDAGREGRHEGEGDEERDDDREAHREPEASPEAADQASHERHREEDRNQGDGGRDDGEHDLLGPGHRGLPGGAILLVHVAKDVLEHDDGVIDHDAGRYGEPQHRDVVQREAGPPHGEEGGDDRGRDGHGGDEGGPPVPPAEEDPHDQARQEGAEDEVVLDLAEGPLDEAGLVADDVDRHVGGQRAP